MTSSRRAPAIAWLLTGSLIAALAAAQGQPPRMWYVHTEQAKPSQLAQYEATTKEFMAAVRQNAAAMPHFHISAAYMTDDQTYGYVVPLKEWNDIGAVFGEFDALAKAMGPAKLADLMRRGGLTSESSTDFVLMEPAELGYVPAAPRLKPEETRYFRFDTYYIQPGNEEEADKVAAEFAALWKKKGIRNGYRLFKVVTGQNMPALIVMGGAKDAVDFAQAEAEDQKAIGAEGQALFARAFALCRRIEHQNAWARPDLTTAMPMAK